MRAAIYNPYLDTLGGGERYSMAVARVLADKGYRVDVEWKNKKIRQRLEERFGIDLADINFIPNVNRGDGYDVCFWVSDGSIPTLFARKNFLHFQFPFHDVNGGTLLNRMKLFRINKILCNSYFTKGFIDKEYRVDSTVIYPPVAVEKIKPKRKENVILFVGRFSQLKQAKRQDVLVKAFKTFFNAGFSDWRLVLAGGTEVGGGEFVEEVKKSVHGYPVEIYENPSFKDLKDLYGRAKIFWSAVGFGADEEKEPEKCEHFGISVVEAMSAGAVPVVFRGGGHNEIVDEEINGLLWDTPSKFIRLTKKLISDKGMLIRLSRSALEKSKSFGYERFNESFKSLLK